MEPRVAGRPRDAALSHPQRPPTSSLSHRLAGWKAGAGQPVSSTRDPEGDPSPATACRPPRAGKASETRSGGIWREGGRALAALGLIQAASGFRAPGSAPRTWVGRPPTATSLSGRHGRTKHTSIGGSHCHDERTRARVTWPASSVTSTVAAGRVGDGVWPGAAYSSRSPAASMGTHPGTRSNRAMRK